SALYLWTDLLNGLDMTIAYASELGVTYITCVFPSVADPARLNVASKSRGEQIAAIWEAMTLDDWKWNAEQLNKTGARTKKAGIQMAYHHHDLEFKTFAGKPALDHLLELTDPDLVKFEMDCMWVKAAGHDPAAYLLKHPGRFALLH